MDKECHIFWANDEKLIIENENETELLTPQEVCYKYKDNAIIMEKLLYILGSQIDTFINPESEIRNNIVHPTPLERPQNIVVPNENFDQMLKELTEGNYSLGIHGINNNFFTTGLYNKDNSLNHEKIAKIKSSILNIGLRITGERSLLSTAKFENIYQYTPADEYRLGGVIIALPKILESEDGRKIFLGTLDEEQIIKESRIFRNGWLNRNYEYGCLSDLILPDYGEKKGNLPSIFILGTYDHFDAEHISFTLNPQHIIFKSGKVSNQYFNAKNDILNSYYKEIPADYMENECLTEEYANIHRAFYHTNVEKKQLGYESNFELK